MRFWDTSALASLVMGEVRSPVCHRLLREDPSVAAWIFTDTEIRAAIYRRRFGRVLGFGITEEEAARCERRLDRIELEWRLIEDVRAVRGEAASVVREYGLRTGDALQLAAARVWAGDFRKRRVIVTADGELADAAEEDGFTVERVA